MISSATVIAKDCIDADALATTLMLLEVDKGLDLIEGLENVEAYMIYFKNDVLYDVETSNFSKYKTKDN